MTATILRKAPADRAKHLGPHKWKPGQSGNPKGRVAGSRNKLQEDFFESLLKAWTKYGDAALMAAAMTTPTDFVRIVAALMPRDIEVAITNIRVERMPTSELESILDQYRKGSGNLIEAQKDQNEVFQVGETVRRDPGEASSPADGKAGEGKSR